jgi:hypothetical protein
LRGFSTGRRKGDIQDFHFLVKSWMSPFLRPPFLRRITANPGKSEPPWKNHRRGRGENAIDSGPGRRKGDIQDFHFLVKSWMSPFLRLEMQTSALLHFFKVLRDWYGGFWMDKDNAFLSAAGFSGGIDFFKTKLVFYCKSQKSFETETIKRAMDLDPQAVILRSHLKGLQGRGALRGVSDMLVERFNPQITDSATKMKF